jgi:hypothetical protein
MPQRGRSGQAVTADTPGRNRLGKLQRETPRIQVSELMTDRRGRDKPGEGRERQDTDLREEFLERIAGAGAAAGQAGDVTFQDVRYCVSYKPLGLRRRVRVSLCYTGPVLSGLDVSRDTPQDTPIIGPAPCNTGADSRQPSGTGKAIAPIRPKPRPVKPAGRYGRTRTELAGQTSASTFPAG